MVRSRRPPVAAPPTHPRPTTVDRRRVVAGAAALAVAGCLPVPVFAQTAEVGPGTGTPPVPIIGFDDPQRWAGRTVVVGAWGGEVQDALRAAVWEPFAAATGCAVREVTTDYSRLATAVQAGDFAADLLLVDQVWAATALEQGLTVAIDPAAVDPAAAERFPGGSGTIPAYAYALVAAYRREAITAAEPPADWAAWWDRERYPGPRALGRDPFGSFEAALLAGGVAAEALYPLDQGAAIAGLQAVSGSIVERWWDSGEQPVAWLGSGRTDFASAWHHRVVAGQWDGYAVDLAWKGALLVVDRWAIPSGAEAVDVATDLVRFGQVPEVQAALAERVPLGPTHPAAFDHLDPMLLPTLPTAPAVLPQLVRTDAAWWAANRGEAVQRMNEWLLGRPGA